MSFPVLQKRYKGQKEFSIEVCGIYFATQTARLTFMFGHVLGFVHYVRVRGVTDFWGIFRKHIQDGIKEEGESFHFISLGGHSERWKGIEGPLPRRLIRESLTCLKTQAFRDVQLFQLLSSVGTIYRSTLVFFRGKKSSVEGDKALNWIYQ